MDWDQLEEADWLFRKMVRRFIKERDKILIEGVALPGLLILNKIIRDGAQRLGDLAEELDFTSGAVTALSDKLEEKGLAVRCKGKDRRTVLLDITDKGREMLQQNQNIGRCCITILFDGLDKNRLSEQISAYRQIIGNLEHFSEIILGLARENSERAQSADLTGRYDSENRKSRFLSY